MTNTVTYGDRATINSLNTQTARLNQLQDQQTEELATGITSDVSSETRGDYSVLSQINTGISISEAYQNAATEAGFFADMSQNTLTSLQSRVSDFGTEVQTMSSSGQGNIVESDALGSEDMLSDVFSMLNSQAAGQSLFAGTSTTSAAVGSVDDVYAALDPLMAGLTDAADVEAVISDWIADPAGYDAVVYQGGDARASTQVSANQSVSLDVTAQDPAIKKTIEGLLMSVYAERAPDLEDVDAKRELLDASSVTLRDADDALIELQASLGVQQEKIETAKAANSSEISALEMARTDLIGIDEYETATELEQTQAQIELLYTLTSRLSQLTLLDFIR